MSDKLENQNDAAGTPKNPYAADPISGPAPQVDSSQEGDGTGGVIPYKNPKALTAYYLGILSGIPLIGLPFGIAAFVLGIQGLKARKQNPVIKGSVHAGIGIGCGLIFTLFAAPFALKPKPRGGMAGQVAIGSVLALLIYLGQQLATNTGVLAGLPPALAVALPALAVLAVGVLMIRRTA